MIGRIGRGEFGQPQDALVHRGEAHPGAGRGAQPDRRARPRRIAVRRLERHRQLAHARIDADPGQSDGAAGARFRVRRGAEHVHRDIRAGAPVGGHRDIDIGAAGRHRQIAHRMDAIRQHQQRRLAGERRSDVDTRGVARRVGLAVGRDIDLVRHVRVVRGHPAGAEPHGCGGHAAILQHLDAVAAEVQRARDAERRIGGNIDRPRLQRFVAPHRLVAREAAIHHQPPVGPLAHQAQLRLQSGARTVGVDRGDVERGLGAGIHRIVGEGRLDADQPAGGPHRDLGGGKRGVPGRVVDPGGDGRLQRMRRVRRPRDRDRQRRMPLCVGVRQRQVLRVRSVGLVDQTDAIAGQRRERRGIDQQPHLPLPGQAGGGRAEQEPRGHRQGVRLAGDDRSIAGAEVHRHPIRHEGIDAELRPPDRRQGGIGLHLDRPGPGRRAGRQRHRQMHRGVRRPRRRRVQEHLPVRPLHDDMHGNVGGPPGIVAQQRHHLRRLAWPVDAAIQPDIGVERAGMRQPATPRSDRSKAALLRSSIV